MSAITAWFLMLAVCTGDARHPTLCILRFVDAPRLAPFESKQDCDDYASATQVRQYLCEERALDR